MASDPTLKSISNHALFFNSKRQVHLNDKGPDASVRYYERRGRMVTHRQDDWLTAWQTKHEE